MAGDLTYEQVLQRVETDLANNAGMNVEGEILQADITRTNSMLALIILAPTHLAQAVGQAKRVSTASSSISPRCYR
ncbi:hypothetical protein [Pantoea sp. AS142]|uniref:hypothetical protein n=1 Tax=Pantoea sp. AS142 TaxID=3081292 RepID=UPI00301AD37B